MHSLQDDDGTPKSATPKSAKSFRHGPKTKSFSKERPTGIIKDRPATILGSAIKSQRVSRRWGGLGLIGETLGNNTTLFKYTNIISIRNLSS